VIVLSNYELWKLIGRPDDHFAAWNRQKITEWAQAHGFCADSGGSWGALGVTALTQAEANRKALCQLGEDHYGSWLKQVVLEDIKEGA